MSLKRLKKKGKKAFLAKLSNKLFYLGRKRKPVIALEAYTAFHFEHFKSVLKYFSYQNDIEVVVFTPEKQNISFEFDNITYYTSLEEYPLYKTIELFISTDLNKVPYWLNCHSVYFGHGMGPKLNYVANEGLLQYDYVFSPSKPTFDIQANFLGQSRVFQIGMPLLDDQKETLNLVENFPIDENKPTLLYAPSWCTNVEKISNINQILDYLSVLTQFNIIVSPHPLLFNPKRCNGKVYFSELKPAKHMLFNKPNSGISTLDIVKSSQIVLSDISSIMFEAMALGKKVCFDGNKKIYEFSEALSIYDDLIEICPPPNWDDDNDKTISQMMTNEKLFNEQQSYIQEYLFNNGQASQKFVERSIKLLHSI
jgi:hypothetical protein